MWFLTTSFRLQRFSNSLKDLLAERSHKSSVETRVAESVSQSQWFLGGVGFFVRLRKYNWIIFYITLLSWEFLLEWYNFF